MKRSNHESYSDVQEALVALTKTCFKTGDVILKEFLDDLEEYLGTEYPLIIKDISDESEEEGSNKDDEGPY